MVTRVTTEHLVTDMLISLNTDFSLTRTFFRSCGSHADYPLLTITCFLLRPLHVVSTMGVP